MNNLLEKLRPTLQKPAFWLLVFLMVVPASMSLTGRYSSLPHNDLVQDTMNAWNFIHHGEFPKHSGISTYYGAIPPGISYAFVPGMFLFPDNPTAAERFGAALMFAGTMLGLYLWLNKRLGVWPTVLVLLLFLAGRSGSFYLYSLWPRGHVFFVVWFLYFLTLWVERRDARWLGASLIVFAASTYWFMELVPLFAVLPILYFLYKPPLGWKAIVTSGLVGFLIWLPYLVYEYPRDFIDLRAIVTQKILVDSYDVAEVVSDKSHHIVDSWDVPALKEKAAKNGGHLPEKEKGIWLVTEAWGKIWAETETRFYLGEPGYVFYHPHFDEWCFQSFTTGRVLRPGHTEWEQGAYKVEFPKELMKLPPAKKEHLTLAESLHAFAPFYNIGGAQRFPLFVWHMVLFLFAICYVVKKGFSLREWKEAARNWMGILSRRNRSGEFPLADKQRLVWTIIALALVVPLVLQCALVKSWSGLWDSERRFVWLWLAEALALGAALGTVRLGRFRPGLIPGFIAMVTLAINPLTLEILTQAYSSLPGQFRSKEDLALDATAALIKKEGLKEPSIGYDLNTNKWMFLVRPIDGVSKSAIDWDVVFFLRHGIKNRNTTVEGLSPDDDYRIHDPDYNVPHECYWRSRWSMTYDGSLPPMEKVAEAGGFEILAREKNAADR